MIFNNVLKTFFHRLSLILLHNKFESCHLPFGQYVSFILRSLKVFSNQILDLLKSYGSVDADVRIIIVQSQAFENSGKCLQFNHVRYISPRTNVIKYG